MTLTGVAESCRALEKSINEHMRREVQRAAYMTAAEAKARHKFQNRTGKLEASIHAGRTRGVATRGSLVAEVLATTKYASYVEEKVTRRGKWAYLEPAWDRTFPEFYRHVHTALTVAIRTAGWGGG